MPRKKKNKRAENINSVKEGKEEVIDVPKPVEVSVVRSDFQVNKYLEDLEEKVNIQDIQISTQSTYIEEMIKRKKDQDIRVKDLKNQLKHIIEQLDNL